MLSIAIAAAMMVDAQGTSRWITVFEDDRRISHIDVGTMRSFGDRRILWIRTEYHAPADGVAVDLFENEMDCLNQTYALISYEQQDEYGETVSVGTIPPGERRIGRVQPDSQAETIYNLVCR